MGGCRLKMNPAHSIDLARNSLPTPSLRRACDWLVTAHWTLLSWTRASSLMRQVERSRPVTGACTDLLDEHEIARSSIEESRRIMPRGNRLHSVWASSSTMIKPNSREVTRRGRGQMLPNSGEARESRFLAVAGPCPCLDRAASLCRRVASASLFLRICPAIVTSNAHWIRRSPEHIIAHRLVLRLSSFTSTSDNMQRHNDADRENHLPFLRPSFRLPSPSLLSFHPLILVPNE